MRLRELASVRYGYRRLQVLLRREGWLVNAKRVYRWYRLEGLGIPARRHQKRASALRPLLPPAHAPNEQWSRDFLSERLGSGQRFRVFTLVANRTRERLALEADQSLTGRRVVAVLERVSALRGLPQVLQVDHGPEFTSQALDAWAHQQGVKLALSRPGTPTDHPYIEAFNGRLRQECLDQQWFFSLQEARDILEKWRRDDNTIRPHTALGYQTPAAFKAVWQQQQPNDEVG